jgi:hypothetical protein
MQTLQKAEVIVIVAIALIGGGILVSAGTIPKYWTQVQHWTGNSIGELDLGPTDFKNGTTYHIVMAFTPKWVGNVNNTVFVLQTQWHETVPHGGINIIPVQDWGIELSQSTTKIVKEYTYTVGKETIEDVIVIISCYYGGYDIRIESLAAVIDAAAITAQ